MLTRVPILPIYDAASARQLAQAPLFRRPRARIVVALRTMAEARQRRIETRLNRLYNACGCTAGTWALGLALVTWVGGWTWVGDFPQDALVMIPVGLVFAIVAAGSGKVGGLLLARRALRIELFRLAAEADSASREAPIADGSRSCPERLASQQGGS